MIVLIDNYDSFTWNLAQALGSLGARVEVLRNDALTVDRLLALGPERLVISPGPGTPDGAGISLEAIGRAAGHLPILGVCLGHQAIAQAFGGRVRRAPKPLHGKTSPVAHDGRGLFAGLPSPLIAARYHSLIVEEAGLPETLEVAARVEGSGEVMGLRHRRLPIHGLQFHPESFLTPLGVNLLANFLRIGPAAEPTDTPLTKE